MKLTREALEEAIENSSSMRQVSTYLGYAISGQTTKMLRKKIEEYGLVEPSGGSHSRRKQEFEEILVENSTYQSSRNLKQRLVKAGMLEDKCNKCGIGNEWNGKPLTLQLEHINGIHSDNRIENLIILCPNCHTQTPTWGRKNRGPLV